jgi:sodium-dependent dicarboxylate transporter 2/3/5
MKNNLAKTGLILGPIVFIALLLLLPGDMAWPARAVAATSGLMATWWITEAIAIPATAMLPIVLFPLMGVMNGSSVTLHYANHLVYLFLGGFLIGMAIEKSNLHHRIALNTVRLTGLGPARVVLGFMLSSAFLSMWISNTASAMIMFTIAMAFLAQVKESAAQMGTEVPAQFGTGLMLAIAYSCSVGGISTLVGTPSNAVLVGVFETTFGTSINFVDWMLLATPLALVMLLLVWIFLVRIRFHCGEWKLPVSSDWLDRELASLGQMTTAEKRTMAVSLFVISLWLIRGFSDWAIWSSVQDSTISILGALLLFLIPSGEGRGSNLLDWQSAKSIPWDVLLLFGGGFALAAGFVESGLVAWLAESLTFLSGLNPWFVLVSIVALVIFLTELTSNTATAAMLLPVTVSVAAAMGAEPLGFMIAATLASSFAFMMPVATPPNAIVYSSRMVSIGQMAGAGIWLNILGLLLISVYVVFAAPLLLG